MTQALQDICDVLRHAHRLGWISSRDGNASYQPAGSSSFWVTPSGAVKHHLQPHHLLEMVWQDGQAVALSQAASGTSARPTGELELHQRLMRHCRTERCVVHLHPTYTVAALYAGHDLRELARQFPEINRYTRVGPSVGIVPPISQELAAATVDALGLDATAQVAFDIVALDRHGVVAVDRNPWLAFEHIERVEHICKAVLCSGRR